AARAARRRGARAALLGGRAFRALGPARRGRDAARRARRRSRRPRLSPLEPSRLRSLAAPLRRAAALTPRVLQVLACDAWGGTEVQVAGLVLATDRRHCEMEVAILDRPGPLSAHLSASSARVHRLSGPFGHAGALVQLAQVTRRGRFDVVEAYGFKAGML